MRTELPEPLLATKQGARANEILRSCVHCGFCLATCPTYQLDGNELDSPRGRIYLIKNLLEQDVPDGEEKSAIDLTEQHLDRCLTCRACETTCPSGVAYGELLEIGRNTVNKLDQQRVNANIRRGLVHTLLRLTVPNRRLMSVVMRSGQWLKKLLPSTLLPQAVAEKIPERVPMRSLPVLPMHRRRVLLLEGCVQKAATPQVTRDLRLILNEHGVTSLHAKAEVCCGALPQHLGYEEQAQRMARKNIDAWWPFVSAGIEAIISTASGCGVTLKEYPELLSADPVYGPRAERMRALVVDVSEYLTTLDWDQVSFAPAATEVRAQDNSQDPGEANDLTLAWHAPCTLQHGQRVAELVPELLQRAGYNLSPVADAHLCCGSAGTYSILQPDRAKRLRERKLAALQAHAGDQIVTANVGCQMFLAEQAERPVQHWVSALAARIEMS